MFQILRYGSQGPAVGELRSLLGVFGLTPPVCDENFETFDEELLDDVTHFQQTHSGPDGKPLVVDGIVGSKTWWALRRDPNLEDHSTHGVAVPTGLTPMRRRVLIEALQWLADDVREVPMGSNRGPMVDRCLPGWAKRDGERGPPWCSYCADHITHEATGCWPCAKGRSEGGCLKSYRYAEAHGLLSAYPIPGDLFVILYRDSSGNLTGKGHKGIVGRADDTHINGLEGNYNNAFRASLRPLPSIAGFINWFPDHEQPEDWERGTVDVSAPRNETTR